MVEKLFSDLLGGSIKTPVPTPSEPDMIPAVRDPDAATHFLPPDYDEPAQQPQPRDVSQLLTEMNGYLSQLVTPDPGIVWQHAFSRLPLNEGETSLIASERVRFIYVPNVPREMEIYSGSSRGLFLGRVVKGQSLQVELPYATNGVFIVFKDGGANEQVNVYLSSRAIDIQKKIDFSSTGPVWQ